MPVYQDASLLALLAALRRQHAVHVALTLTQLEREMGVDRLPKNIRKVILDALNSQHRAVLDLLQLHYED
ncbi:MAG: hypothetical protein D6823_03170 [Chloroflexi bacterium]|jgi:hypothetical protein|nr:MAG: hypothetical protein D6823_03170 [Chloroflexota bacterium]